MRLRWIKKILDKLVCANVYFFKRNDNPSSFQLNTPAMPNLRGYFFTYQRDCPPGTLCSGSGGTVPPVPQLFQMLIERIIHVKKVIYSFSGSFCVLNSLFRHGIIGKITVDG